MRIGLIGKKIGMSREFIESGQSIPVTIIKVEKVLRPPRKPTQAKRKNGD